MLKSIHSSLHSESKSIESELKIFRVIFLIFYVQELFNIPKKLFK